MKRIERTYKALRVLDFDIENRPSTYWYDGKCTAEITAIAWSWVGETEVKCVALPDMSLPAMLMRFREAYDQADIVTGHYIRRHDLPIINAHLFEYGLPLLTPKDSHDTKLDLPRMGAISLSQEAISALLRLEHPKHHMTQTDWREANRLTPEGVLKTKERVIKDVIQHKELYAELRPILKRPKLWTP